MREDGAALLAYHRRTALRPGATRLAVESWNRPRPFKLYEGLESLPLPHVAAPAASMTPLAGEPKFDLPTLAALLHWSAGVTRRRRLTDGSVMQFRAASCTGALYHVEVYVVCAGLPGLPAGVYHYAPQNETLRRLRRGDLRAQLVDACGGDAALAEAPMAVVLTSEFWRNAWRYGERTYRHAFWDAGTILANLLALAAADGLPARVLTAFDDAAVNTIIAVDGVSEAALAVVALGSGAPVGQAPAALETIAPRVVPSSPRTRTLPGIAAAHAASALAGAASIARWRETIGAFATQPAMPASRAISLPNASKSDEPVEAIIARRGSARRFAEEQISMVALSAVCRAAAAVIDGDAWPDGGRLCDVLLVAGAIAGIAPGVHRLRSGAALALLAEGDLRESVAKLVPDAARTRAAATIWWTADLEPGLQQPGGRGYRVAQLEAGTALGRVYLAATAAGLGVTGLTFFDEEAARFVASWAPGRSAVLAATVGIAAGPSYPRPLHRKRGGMCWLGLEVWHGPRSRGRLTDAGRVRRPSEGRAALPRGRGAGEQGTGAGARGPGAGARAPGRRAAGGRARPGATGDPAAASVRRA